MRYDVRRTRQQARTSSAAVVPFTSWTCGVVMMCMCAVVLYGGQEAEEKAAASNFEVLYWRLRSLFKRTFYLMFFVVLQGNISSPFSYLIVALMVIRTGTINGKPVTRNGAQEAGQGMGTFINALTSIPDAYSTIGTIAGITHRVSQLLEALEELEVRLRNGCWCSPPACRHYRC